METQDKETLQPEETPKPEATQVQSTSDQTPPPEEPIILNKLYPDANKDLDALFPDPGMKKLLKDVVKVRQKNDRFLKRLHIGESPSEGDEEPEEPA